MKISPRVGRSWLSRQAFIKNIEAITIEVRSWMGNDKGQRGERSPFPGDLSWLQFGLWFFNFQISEHELCLFSVLQASAAMGEGVFSFREPSLETQEHICLGKKERIFFNITFRNLKLLDVYFLEWLLIFPGFSEVCTYIYPHCLFSHIPAWIFMIQQLT